MALQFTNNAKTTLAAGISDVDTSLTVVTGDGANFPLVSSPDTFYITLENITTGVFEVCLVTERASGSPDTFTITRGQDNTTAVAWVVGDLVELRICAAVLDSFEGHDHDTVYSPIVHNHDSDYIQVTGGTMTGSLFTVTPAADNNSTLAVNSEWIDTNYNIYEIGTGIPNAVLPSEKQLLFIASKAFSLPESLTNSVAYANTAPSAAVSFDIRKNDISVGSVNWAISTSIATFTMASAVSFAASDRLTIESPANCYGIAGVSITLLGTMVFA